MEDSEITAQKQIQFYGAGVNAWFNTALEHDKSILALSAAGIGLLITLLTTTGLGSSEALLLYAGAILSFLFSIFCILLIFNRNKAYIERVVSGSNEQSDPFLTRLDHAAIGAFGAGVVFSVLIGLSAGLNSYTKGKQTMTEKKINEERIISNESFDNFARLQPKTTNIDKSFDGAARLQPQAAVPQADQPAAPTSNSSSQTTGQE